jgi:uncharacterized protein YndB with AHSA1/START domain
VIYVTVERIVRRPPELVWDVLTEVAALPAWIEGCTEAEVVSEEERGVGTLVKLVRQTGKARSVATAEVTAWREARLLALETRIPNLLLLDRAVLEPIKEGTALGVYAEFVFGSAFTEFFARPRGLLGASPEEPAVQGIYERSVEALVKRIEALSAIPYR